jgi:hypothetical protein
MRWVLVVLLGMLGCATAARPDQSGDAAKNDSNKSFLDAPVQMDANNCAMQPCSILPTQCGCAPGSACDVDTMDLMGTACRLVTTPGHETNTCGSLKDCDAGYVCLGQTGSSACKKYCSTNTDCGSPRGQCVIDITDGTNPIPGLPPVCSSNCDPTNTAAGGCPAGFKCGIFSQPHMGMTFPIVDCSLAGTGTQGTNCKVGANGDDKLCAPNFLCTTVNAGTNFNCRKICNKTANSGCVGAQTCLSFNPVFVVANTEYGVCN